MKTTRFILTAAVAIGMTACAHGPKDTTPASGASEFEQALPTEAVIGITLPGDGTAQGALTEGGYGTQEGALVGATSELWAHTAGTAAGVRFGLAAILLPIRWVVTHVPPVLIGQNKALWTGTEPLDPQRHALFVEKKPDGHFTFLLASQLKAPPGAKWRVQVAGTYTPDGTPDIAQGAVWVNLDNDLKPETQGKVMALWSHNGPEREVSVLFFNFTDDNGKNPPTDSAYHFQQNADQSGLAVQAIKDIDINKGEPGKEALEHALLVSRWTAEGAGRADAFAAGGDVAEAGYEVAVQTQCWAADSFKTTFEALTVKKAGAEPFQAKKDGDFSTCPFADEPKAELPEQGEAPTDPAMPVEIQ